MSDGERTEPPAEADSVDVDPDEDSYDEDDVDGDEAERGVVFSHYGVASAVLGVLSVAAVVLGFIIWSNHRDQVAERGYLSHVMQSAAEWANVLINMNSGNVDASLQRLHDGTVGELNTDFDAAVQPYKAVVEKLQSKSAGRIEAVAIETVHHDLDTQPEGTRPPREIVTTKLPPFASRTDSVMLIATSVSENVGAKPQTVHWNLRLDVSDVDGKAMISGLASIR
ncbi:hypothetical protein [Mycobacterium sp. 852002-40037_SCH5390672]|uniref:hypothetical protein n=1 Tax=Mycobacterium sp. 852002-40037_SCH5390672 TaxID=1834089 RepID=UPI000804FF48|nr:hypothetical protein [Mycobacterium sp. 852002-40037_SCH5390672]OBB96179.1 hypothetical protein A5782_05515 [Mycobacterium sp. 852002-40037_SCH5390672]